MIGLVVPVMLNFKGFTQLIQTVDVPVLPFIHNNWDKNIGVSKAWNAQIARAIEAKCEYIFVANDDTLLEKGTIKKLTDALDEGHDVVSPINTRDFEVDEWGGYHAGADYAFFGITPKTIERFGWFDENIHSYFNDDDYSRRIVVGGGSVVTRRDAGFYHHGSVTQLKGGDPNTEDRVVSHDNFREAAAYYSLKWGGGKGEETFQTPFGEVDNESI